MEEPSEDLYWNLYDRELLKRTATSKGFGSVNEHMRYLLKNDTGYCGLLYHKFKDCECEVNCDQILCKNLKNRLISDCSATCSGNSISVDKAFQNGPEEAAGPKQIKLMAELRGMSEGDYMRMVRKEEKSQKYWLQRMVRKYWW